MSHTTEDVVELVRALRAAREELHCTPQNQKELYEMAPGEFAWGHWCPHCDNSVDRNGELRKRIDAALDKFKELP